MIGYLTQVIRAIAFVFIALLLCGVIFEFAGFSAPLMFQSIDDGAFLSVRAWENSLRWGLPLFLTALGVVISFRCGFFNIGAQGQFYMGAIAATFVADGLNGAPAVLVMPLTFAAGILGGAVWALWPGLLRVRSGTDEVITTLMGNFIAGLFLVYVTSGPLKDPSGTGPHPARSTNTNSSAIRKMGCMTPWIPVGRRMSQKKAARLPRGRLSTERAPRAWPAAARSRRDPTHPRWRRASRSR